MHKKVAVIGTAGLPAKYGGFESLAEYLTSYLGSSYNMTVYCSSKLYQERKKVYNNAQLKYLPLHANGVQSISYDIISICHALRYANILLILGVSGCIILPFIKIFSHKTIIVNIDGLEWKRDKWGKLAKWFLKYSEKLAVKYADVIIADNKVIQEYVKEYYGVHSELIAYGADHTTKEELSQKVLAIYPFLQSKYAFKVCRIEPENNIDIILEAFEMHPDLKLVIVGNWENSHYGRQIRERFKDIKNIHLLDPIYDQKILNQLRSNCYVYIHGHSAGGTNPSLVEAMYLGLPIISFNANYNLATTDNLAKYFGDKDELLEILKRISNPELKLIAKNMRMIAQKKYNWKYIANQYASLFTLKENKPVVNLK